MFKFHLQYWFNTIHRHYENELRNYVPSGNSRIKKATLPFFKTLITVILLFISFWIFKGRAWTESILESYRALQKARPTDRNVDMFTIILNLYATNDTQGVFTIRTLYEFEKSQYLLGFRSTHSRYHPACDYLGS